MLNQLGDEKIYYKDPLFISRSSKTGKLSAIAFNYPKEYEQTVPSMQNFTNYMNASSKTLDIVLEGLNPNACFEIEVLDKMHGNVYDAYLNMGAPHSPNIREIEFLRQKAWDTVKEIVKVDEDGRLILKRDIDPWSCILIREL